MGTFSALLAVAAAASVAASDPLHTALDANGGSLCFERSYDSAWLKSHRGQTLRTIRMSLTGAARSGSPFMRLSFEGKGRPIYMFGECNWYEGDLNRGVQDNILDPSFKPLSGVGCHLYTDLVGGSAEEGGDFPVEWVDGGRALQVHLPDLVAGWRSFDIRRNRGFYPVAPADRIARLNRVPASACKELEARFAPNFEL